MNNKKIGYYKKEKDETQIKDKKTKKQKGKLNPKTETNDPLTNTTPAEATTTRLEKEKLTKSTHKKTEQTKIKKTPETKKNQAKKKGTKQKHNIPPVKKELLTQKVKKTNKPTANKRE
ncbi:hypothetical protein [Salegentibacter holothuriorum]|uniref:hypothetical protein n=1 Tax=Salegentibacter holothuriorum TaxID=241145 RepID=UPI0011173835|nr:hypothetical protein [Salegentibacter holothuriorum]